jgi:hypothetical protein
MAIGRVEGPMLLTSLDRQGVDLSFSTNNLPLLYLDFTGNTVNVRGQGGFQVFNVYGNLFAGNGVILENDATITTFYQNQNLTLQANGTGSITVVRANVQSGQINNTTIGLTTPVAGTFAALNSTRLTSGVGRVVYTDSQGLIDTDDFRYFSSNATLVAGNVISKSGTIGYGNVTITANLNLLSANVSSVGFFNASQQLVSSNAFKFFTANNTALAGNLLLPNLAKTRITYIDNNGLLNVSSALQFDGLNMTATGITTMGNVQIFNNQITITGGASDLYLTPPGKISVQGRLVTDLQSPVSPNDAVTKQYVDDRTNQSSASTIGTNTVDGLYNSYVQVSDNSLGQANVVMVVDGVRNSIWTSSFANIFSVYIYSGTIGTQSGRLILQPGNNDKIQAATNTAFTLPVGDTSSRPTLPDVGDMRYNNSAGTIEWYDGVQWEYPQVGSNTIASQRIIPDGVNTSYTLLRSTTSEAVLVSINGVVQQPNQAYSVIGTTITFTEVPLITDILEIRSLNTIVAYAVNPIVVDTPYTTIGNSATTIDQFYISFYRSARYVYSAKSASTGTYGQYEEGEVYVLHNSIVSFSNVSSKLNTAGSSLISFTTAIDAFGILTVSATGTATDTKIKLHRLYFTDV